MSKDQIVKKDDIVVRFAGDSGDGMQLSGTLFSDASALTGNDIATFPDYPAEIRAPHNTIAGVWATRCMWAATSTVRVTNATSWSP